MLAHVRVIGGTLECDVERELEPVLTRRGDEVARKSSSVPRSGCTAV